MRRTISAFIVSAGLVGFGLSAQAAPAPVANLLGASAGDVQTVQMSRMERRVMRRRMERRMDRRMERRAVRRSIIRSEMRGR